MVRTRCPIATALALVLSLILGPSGAAAQSEPFFKGKTINLYIGFAPGGTYDYYSRLVARLPARNSR
jgi:tripartite-type tricarboxylate transporter receptor subunit TctC